MKISALKGVCFGLASGTITTLGTLVGLSSGTNSKMAVIGGIVSIAIADSFSDSLGIHLSEESDKSKSHKEVWNSTIATFFSKFLFSSLFILPVLFFPLFEAVILSIIMGFISLGLLSYLIAQVKHEKPLSVISEHFIIAFVVIIITYYAGQFISGFF
ncbi:MAG: VIT1/CCC1 transporter family protein [Nanobdellota archaeon]